MRTLILALGAASLALPTAVAFAPVKAEAKAATSIAAQGRYNRDRRYAYREWRGRDGRRYCRKPDGTTGLVVGGVAGALLGRTIDTDGDRTMGTVIGGVAGALAGREIDRSSQRRRCR